MLDAGDAEAIPSMFESEDALAVVLADQRR